MIKKHLTGGIPSFSTPFQKDGEIDYASIRNMLEFYIANDAKAIMLTAGDSHYICISDKEIAEITKFVVKQVAGRAVVISADRYYDTKRAIEFAKYSADIGVDIMMVMPPDWGHSTTPQTLSEHYKAVSENIPVMIVTNVFIPRGQEFGLETLRRCLDSKNIIAVKDDFCGHFSRKLSLLAHPKWTIISGGQKQNHLDLHLYGCDGYLSTFMRFKPEIAKSYWKHIKAGNLKAAVAIVKNIDIPFFDLIGQFDGKFDSGIHGALEIFGLAKRWRRAPYQSICEEEMERLKYFFKEKELI